MTVWVDTLINVRGGSPAWRWPTACHLFSDDLDELHRFAAQIGLKRSWFQGGDVPHYDLNARKRRRAVEAGAVPLMVGPRLKQAFAAARKAAREHNAEVRDSRARARVCLPYLPQKEKL